LLVLKFLRDDGSPSDHAKPTFAPVLVEAAGVGVGVGVGFGVVDEGLTTGAFVEVGVTTGTTLTLVEVGLTDTTTELVLGRGLQRLDSARFFFARAWW
jgi:hypothetical protein